MLDYSTWGDSWGFSWGDAWGCLTPTETEIKPTGIGAVLDVRQLELDEAERVRRELQDKQDLREIVARAFRGKDPETKAGRNKIKRSIKKSAQSLPNVDLNGLQVSLDMIVERFREVERAREDEEAIAILLLAM